MAVSITKIFKNKILFFSLSGRATNDTIGRPAYADAFLDAPYSEFGMCANSVIADVGSGTGKFDITAFLW